MAPPVLIILLFALASADLCPCSDSSLCKPITAPARKEVLGFSSRETAWTSFDWDVLTTVAWNTNSSMLCKAHANNVRVVAQASGINATLIEDSTMHSAWIEQQLAFVKAHFMDGINFDYESPIALSSSLREQYALLVAATTKAFHDDNPYSQVSVDVAWGPYDVDGRNYDYVALADASDILFVMAYDTRSQIYGPCLASANTPAARAELGVQQFLSLGISAEKLVLGLPWYGYDYPCFNTSLTDRYCPIQAVPFRGAPCSDAAGRERYWSDIQSVLHNSSVTRTDVTYDELLVSQWFNYQADDGTIHQVWFDDVKTLTTKFILGPKYDLRGVGVWNLDALYDPTAPSSQQAKMEAMWKAMGVFD